MNATRKMTNLLVASGVSLAVAQGASVVWAEMMPSAGLQQISGKILSVDAASHLLKLEAEKPSGSTSAKQPMEFFLAPEASITEGARKLQPSELQSGAKVQVNYKVEGTKNIAQAVNVQKSTGAAASTKPEGAQSETPSQPSYPSNP